MKILIADDNRTALLLLESYLMVYGACELVEDGMKAVLAVGEALRKGQPYNLICLDINMPNMDGKKALLQIRRLEKDAGIQLGDGAKIIMTTVSKEAVDVLGSFAANCEAYLVKPITREELVNQLKTLGLLPNKPA